MDYSMMMDFKKMFVGPMFKQVSACRSCDYWGKNKTLCKGCLERNRVKYEEPKLF